MFLCGGAYWAVVFNENKRRNRIYGVPHLNQQTVVETAFNTGDTDKVNKDYRYSY